MVKRKERLTDGKKNIIADSIREYDIQSAEDIQDALKDFLGETIESMLAVEMDNHLGYAHMNVPKVQMLEMVKNKRPLEANMEKWKSMYLKTVIVLFNRRL